LFIDRDIITYTVCVFKKYGSDDICGGSKPPPYD